jgi:hypothetical protein
MKGKQTSDQVQWGASRILGQARFPMHHSDNWFRSWSRIQKRPHADAGRTHGDRPGCTQDAGRKVAFGKSRAGQKTSCNRYRDENWYIDFHQDDSLKLSMNTRTQMTDLFHAVRPLYSSQPLEKVVAVGVLPKDRAVLDATANDMVQGTRGIDAGSAGHS